MPRKKLKWFYICLEVIDGEREYHVDFLEQFKSKEAATEVYDTELDESGLDDNGETATQLYKVEEITKEEYKVLSRFI